MALTKQDNIDQATNEIGFLRKYSVDIVEYPFETIKGTPEPGEEAVLPARPVVTLECVGQLRGKIS